MTSTETTSLIAELMNQYNANRARWIETKGSADGFDAWFTEQCGLVPAAAAERRRMDMLAGIVPAKDMWWMQ
jgi:hypothetical protein